MLAEIADETNMARAFALIPLSWAIGSAVGPYLGGILSRPQDRWPNIFSHPFWEQYPYFLPCVATSVYGIASLVIASVFLKETLPRKSSKMGGQRDNPNLDFLPALEHHDGSTTHSSHKTSATHYCQLFHLCFPRDLRFGPSPVGVYDANSTRRTRVRPPTHGSNPGRVWDHERHPPAHHLRPHHRFPWSPSRIHHSHILLRPFFPPLSDHWHPSSIRRKGYRPLVSCARPTIMYNRHKHGVRLCLHIYINCGPKGYARCNKRPHPNCRVHTARPWPRNHGPTLRLLIGEEHYGWLWRVLCTDIVHLRGPMACFVPPARWMEGLGVVLFDL